MSKPLTQSALDGIAKARAGVRRIMDETPECLEGPQLVEALLILLSTVSDSENKTFAPVGLAAAAIAMLIENERAEKRGERVVAA